MLPDQHDHTRSLPPVWNSNHTEISLLTSVIKTVVWSAVIVLCAVSPSMGLSILSEMDVTPSSFPVAIAGDGMGGVWAIEFGPNGTFLEHFNAELQVIIIQLPSDGSYPGQISISPEGIVLFVVDAESVGLFSATGEIEILKLAGASSGLGHPVGIADALDHNAWLTIQDSDLVIRFDFNLQTIDLSVPLAQGSGPFSMVSDSASGVWFTEPGAGKIGRITDSGSLIEYPTGGSPWAITGGPGGGVWYTQPVLNRVGQVDIEGKVREYPIPTDEALPIDISSTTGGAIEGAWFTENAGGKIAWIDPAGTIVEVMIGGYPEQIATSNPGTVWVSDSFIPVLRRIIIDRTGGCPADCLPPHGVVTVDEVIKCVGIALGAGGLDSCSQCDINGDGSVDIVELTLAVRAALTGCPG